MSEDKEDNAITPNLIKHVSGNFDVHVVVRLKLPDLQLKSMIGLEKCISLRELDMKDNRIKKIEGLDTLSRLEKLDLRRNALVRIPRAFLCIENQLQCLLFDGNKISDLDNVENLSIAPKLQSLSFQSGPKDKNADSNPVCQEPDYLATICDVTPDLSILDWQYMKLREAAGLNRHLSDGPSLKPWFEGLNKESKPPEKTPGREKVEEALAALDDAKIRFHEGLLDGKEMIKKAQLGLIGRTE